MTRTCKYESIDLEKFKELLENTMTPDLSLVTPEEIDTVVSAGFESINRVVRQCSKPRRDPIEINENFSWWQKLLIRIKGSETNMVSSELEGKS